MSVHTHTDTCNTIHTWPPHIHLDIHSYAQKCIHAYMSIHIYPRIYLYIKCQLLSSVRLCDPMDCNPPGSSVHGILQARILEWVAIPFSRGSFLPGDQTCAAYISCIDGGFLTTEPPGKSFPEATTFQLVTLKNMYGLNVARNSLISIQMGE